MDTKDAYEKKARARMDEWSAEIDSLKAKAEKADADARLRLQNEIEDIKGKKQAVERKLDDLKSASDDAWDDIKQGVDAASQALGSSLKAAAARFAS